MHLDKSLHKLKVRKSKLSLPLAAVGIAGSLVALSINRRRKTAEEAPSRMLELLEQRSDKIVMRWPNNGGPYHVYREGELVYQGMEPGFADQNLLSGTFYTYLISKVDASGTEAAIMKVQAATSVFEKEKVNYLQDLLLNAIVARDMISMEWEQIPGISEYSVYRNGQLLQNVTTCSFIDKNLNTHEEYTYTIKAKRPLQRSDQLKSEAKSVVANAVGILKKNSSVELAAHEEFTIIKKFAPIQHLLKTVPAEKNLHRDKIWQLRYNTFLKEEVVTNPNIASEDHFFKGDNRGFDPDSSRFRTRADLFIDSNQENASVLLSKEVGLTQAFSKEDNFNEEKRASDEGIKLEKQLTNEKQVKFILSHSVSNPLVVSPAIDYKVCGTFSQNGEIDLVGMHDQAPNHEIYLRETGTEEWQAIHQAESKGLEMMAEPMANHFWRYTTFTN